MLQNIENGAEAYHFAPCGFFQTSANEVVQQINTTLLDWLGYTSEEVVHQKKWTDFLTMGSKIYHQTHFTPLLNMQGQVEEVNFEMRKKDGEKLPVLVNARITRKEDATLLAVYYAVYRFTQRKQYEIELMKAEQEIKEQHDALLTSEEELKMNLEELQAIQTTLAAQNIHLEKTLLSLTETQDHLIQSEKMASLGQLVTSIAHEINTPLGAIRSSVRINSVYLQEVLHDLPIFLPTLTETERELFMHIMQEALNAPQTYLTSKERRQTRQALETFLEANGIKQAYEIADFAVEMSVQNKIYTNSALLTCPCLHEMMQMLNKITAIQLGNQNIEDATNRASKIIFALKNFSRQDHSGEKATTSINDSIETVLTLYYSQIKQGVDVVRHFANLPEILAYPDELVQVWTNLIHNAIHAMEGKGTLTITTQQENHKILTSITDTGAGIPTDIQDKIFNAFFTTKKLGEGSGLGLDIVKKIIDKHVGKIWLESEAGKGTTFFVEIPI